MHYGLLPRLCFPALWLVCLLAWGCQGRIHTPAAPEAAESAGRRVVHREPEGYTYHWTRKSVYEEQRTSGEYRYPDSVMIPTTKTKENLVYYANQILADETQPIVVLVIDETKVRADMRFFSDPDGRDADADPVIYGKLNLDAVAQVVNFKRGEDGEYALPPDMF